MGFMSSSPPPQPAVVMPPPAAHAPVLGSSESATAGANAGTKAAAASGMGFDGTIGTSPQGDTSAPNKAYATLLGQ